ncbi:hypothetical protein F4811DRAFT_87022 [Daldinia bambusicola]|nr:hypothetical protein F4811DRAFT_87022 [Daldinia bambusicola]
MASRLILILGSSGALVFCLFYLFYFFFYHNTPYSSRDWISLRQASKSAYLYSSYFTHVPLIILLRRSAVCCYCEKIPLVWLAVWKYWLFLCTDILRFEKLLDKKKYPVIRGYLLYIIRNTRRCVSDSTGEWSSHHAACIIDAIIFKLCILEPPFPSTSYPRYDEHARTACEETGGMLERPVIIISPERYILE